VPGEEGGVREEAGGEDEDRLEHLGGEENTRALKSEETNEVMDGFREEVKGWKDYEEVGVEREALADGSDGEYKGGGPLEGVGDPAGVSVGGRGVKAFPGLVPEVEEEEAACHGKFQDGRSPEEGREAHGQRMRDAHQAIRQAGGLIGLERSVPIRGDGHHVQHEAETGVGDQSR